MEVLRKSYANGGFDSLSVDNLPNIYQNLPENEQQIAAEEPKAQVSLAWRNLTYVVSHFVALKREKTKVLLDQLTGSFTAGSLNGILGPSGAGKTTLLNLLSGTVTSGLCSDSEIYTAEANPTSYFIAQHVTESIVGQLTVGQILRYAYRFKNGLGSSNSKETIDKVLTDLLLDPSILDRPFSLCSGGEQKRIAIAQELMSHQVPSFLFLDEPTTGLDSAAAYEVMSSLQALARSAGGLTIIASIHAPNHETLNLFDRLYVLAKGGLAVYQGPPGCIQAHLISKLQLKLPKTHQPPVEVLLKIACNGPTDPSVLTLAKDCAASNLDLPVSRLHRQASGLPLHHRPFTFGSLLLQTGRLFRTLFLCNLKLHTFSILQYLSLFLIFASLYNSQMAIPRACYALDQASSNLTCARDLSDSRLVDENNTFHGYTMLLIGFLIMCTSAVIYSPLVKVFQSEHRNSWYSLGAFYWASTLVSFIEVSAYSLLISTLAYFLSSQHSADDYTLNWTRFGSYTLFIWLLAIYTQSIGHLIGALLMNFIEVAIIVCQVAYVLMAVMNGYFVDTEKTGNAAFIGLANGLAVKYVTKGLMWTFYGIDRCDWETEFSSVLLKYHVDQSQLTEYVWRLVVNILLVRAATFATLYWKFGSEIGLLKRLLKRGSRTRIELTRHSAHFLELSAAMEAQNESLQLELKRISTLTLESVDSKRESIFKEFSRYKVLIGWRNLSLYGSSSLYEMGGKRREKMSPILRNLSGEFAFGTLNALMGTSGAGKTSLLKVLNGRCKTRLSEGTEFYLSKYTKINTCFITQEVGDHLMLGLTAQQMLTYASRLKNRGEGEGVDHEAIALKWLHELDLLNTRETKVERCSGGERKRLAVALELTALAMPNCVCIDEPTSGLDTNSAEIVISTLHQLTRSHPLTIITSIHQPTTEILYRFDQLYVLARGGVCIYSGPPKSISTHLTSSLSPSSSPSQYPIETLIKYSCSGHTHPTVQRLVESTASQATPLATLLTSTQLVPDGVFANCPRFSLHATLTLTHRYLAYILGHLWVHQLAFIATILLYGFQLTIFFDPSIAHPSGCIDLDSDFNNTCSRTPEALLEEYQLTENYKYNYFMLVIFLFLLMVQSSLTFGKEYGHFINEHRNGWYSSGSFYLMKSLFETLPLPPIIMVYVYIVNIYTSVLPALYWQLVALLTLSAVGFQGMAHVFSLLSGGSVTLLTVISISIFILFCQISNFFLPLASLHYVYQGLAHLSISRYVFEAALLLQYGFGRCGPKEIQPILYLMSVSDGHFTQCLIMLVVNCLIYRCVAIYLLIRKANPPQRRRQRVQRLEKYQESLRQSKGVLLANGFNP